MYYTVASATCSKALLNKGTVLFNMYNMILLQAVKVNPDHVQEHIELLMELMPIRQQWLPEATFHKLGGITLLTQLVAMSPDWGGYTGK